MTSDDRGPCKLAALRSARSAGYPGLRWCASLRVALTKREPANSLRTPAASPLSASSLERIALERAPAYVAARGGAATGYVSTTAGRSRIFAPQI
jgi:hypothetical protein